MFPSSTITLEAALRDIAQGSPKARAAAAHALGNVSDPTERHRALAALLTACEDDRPEVRAEACASLGDLGEVSAVPVLAKRLGDGVAVVRQNAAIALGSLAHPDGFAPLVEALAEGPADVRFQAATSLAEIDAERAYEPLVAALADRDPQVVAAAALSLGAGGNRRAVTLLIDKLEHPEAATRFDVAYALAELGDPTGRDILVAALGDADRAWDAVGALGHLTDANDALGRALINKKTPPEATALAAGKLLARDASNEAAKRVLIAALTARKIHVRGIAIEQLTEVGGDWAVAPLEKLARSGKGGDFLEAIAAALQKIGERDAVR